MREMKGKHFSTLPLVPLPAYVCTVDDDGLVAVNACEHSVIVVIWLPLFENEIGHFLWKTF